MTKLIKAGYERQKYFSKQQPHLKAVKYPVNFLVR
jgi:hypothetical protein